MISTVVWAFVRQNWAALVLVAASLGAWGYISSLRSTITDQRTALNKKSEEIRVLTENNQALETALSASNAAVEKLSSSANQTKRDFAALSTTVTKQTTEMERRLMEVLQEKTPQSCEDSIKYLIEAARKY